LRKNLDAERGEKPPAGRMSKWKGGRGARGNVDLIVADTNNWNKSQGVSHGLSVYTGIIRLKTGCNVIDTTIF